MTVTIIQKKQCRRCRFFLPLPQFSRNRVSKDGFEFKCRKCRREIRSPKAKPIEQESFPGEVWKIIPNCNSFYSVSNFGRVKREKPGLATQSGRILKGWERGGYIRVALDWDDSRKVISVHELVMQAFVGERPKGLVINHIDGNRQNNKPENLEYVSKRRNSQHGYERSGKTNKPLFGLSDRKINELKNTIKKTNISTKDLAVQYGLPLNSVYQLRARMKRQGDL